MEIVVKVKPSGARGRPKQVLMNNFSAWLLMILVRWNS